MTCSSYWHWHRLAFASSRCLGKVGHAQGNFIAVIQSRLTRSDSICAQRPQSSFVSPTHSSRKWSRVSDPLTPSERGGSFSHISGAHPDCDCDIICYSHKAPAVITSSRPTLQDPGHWGDPVVDNSYSCVYFPRPSKRNSQQPASTLSLDRKYRRPNLVNRDSTNTSFGIQNSSPSAASLSFVRSTHSYTLPSFWARSSLRSLLSGTHHHNQKHFHINSPSMSKVLSLENINPHVRTAQYAVRGVIPQKAETYRAQLAKGEGKDLPFDNVIFANIGNPQQLDQQPITFFRQVASLMEWPTLLESSDVLTEKLGYKTDAIERAKTLLKEVKSVGAYSNSAGAPGIKQSVANFIARKCCPFVLLSFLICMCLATL